MPTIAGIDLNGLRDWAVLAHADEPCSRVLDGGINSGVVRLAARDSEFIAGEQAQMAPHGRGAGWVDVGATRYRLSVGETLGRFADGSVGPEHERAVRASVEWLTRGASSGVLCVPDDESFGEDARDRLLRALRSPNSMNVTLLWRPIAAILAWVETLGAEALPNEGTRVGVLSLLRDRGHLGTAVIEIEPSAHRDRLAVPVRRGRGWPLSTELGGLTLASVAASDIASLSGRDAEDVLATSVNPWRLAVGEVATEGFFRTESGRWRSEPRPGQLSSWRIVESPSPEVVDVLRGLDVLLVEGPAAGCEALHQAVRDWFEGMDCVAQVKRLAPEAVARGSAVAEQRMRRGEPAYYDYLPQIQVNAMVGDLPKFVDLIPDGQRLRGGDVYRGQAAANFAIGQGATELRFFLVKDDEDQPRKATEELPQTADTECRIDIRVEQSPGQGHAKVFITSDEYAPFRNRPLLLDWLSMQPVDQSPESILEELQPRTGHRYPNTQVEPGHPLLWHPNHQAGGLSELLARLARTPLVLDGQAQPDGFALLRKLHERVSRREHLQNLASSIGVDGKFSGRRRALGTDGRIPSDAPVPADGKENLDDALDRVEQTFQVLGAKNFGVTVESRDIVKFSTWCFWSCPTSIVDALLDWYESGVTGIKGTVLLGVAALGRTIHRREHVSRFFRALDERLEAGKRIRDGEYNALNRILTQCETAADDIETATANRIIDDAAQLIISENSSTPAKAYKRKFKFALHTLTVLLRHRRRNPDFLVPGRDPQSGALLAVLRQAGGRLANLASHQSGAAAAGFSLRRDLIDELVEYVSQRGQDPNILVRIQGLDGSSDDDG